MPNETITNQDSNAQLKASLILYDIPQGATIKDEKSGKERPLDNPSGKLRRFAVRINLSCWVCPSHAVPLPVLEELGRAGAVWHVVPFDASAGPQLVKMVISSIKKEIAENVRRGQECLESAAERHLGNEDISEEARYERYAVRAGVIVERLGELLEDLTTAAKQFGVDPKRLNLAGARRAIEAMDQTWHTRVDAWRKARETAKSPKGTSNTHALADDPNVRVGVLADALEDSGDPELVGTAANLREVMTDPETGDMVA